MASIQQLKERVAMLSVASNTALVFLKVFVGALIGSVSILSEAIHSGIDTLAAVIALFSVKTSHLPADDVHSSVTAIFVAVFILKAAYELSAKAIGDLMDVKLSSDEEKWIRSVIVSHKPEIHGFHQLKTRKAGIFILLNSISRSILK